MINKKEKIKNLSSGLGEPGFVFNWRMKAFEESYKMPKDIFNYGLSIANKIPEVLSEKIGKDTEKPIYDYKTSGNARVASLEEVFGDNELSQKLETLLQADLAISSNFYFGMMASCFQSALVLFSGEGTNNQIELSTLSNGNYFDAIFVVLEKGAWLSVVDQVKSIEAKAGSRLLGRTVVVLALEGSNLSYVSDTNLSENGYYLSNKLANVKESAEVSWLDISTGSSFVKSDIRSWLSGDKGKSFCVNLSKAGENQTFDFYNASYHLANDTYSVMEAVGESGGKSKIIYRGMLDVAKDLKGVSGFQNGRFVMTSPYAEVDAIPSLEVRSKDVNTSHAVSVSFLGQDEIFFPSLRGIGEGDAKKMIFDGYMNQALSKIENNFIKRLISENKLDILTHQV